MTTTPTAQPTALATYVPQEQDRGDLLWDPAAHAHAMRVASTLSVSGLLPEHFKGHPANVLIALAMARRLREDPFIVLQSVHVIHGKPGFSAQYMIARANVSGVFKGPIRFRETGSGDTLGVTAYATLTETGDEVSFEVDMKMATAEGWVGRNGSKYKTMPKLMLRYRSATFLVRLFAPQVMLGMQTVEELIDTGGDDEAATVDAKPVTLTPDPDAATKPTKGVSAVAAALDVEAVAADMATQERVAANPTSGAALEQSNEALQQKADALNGERVELIRELTALSEQLPVEQREQLKRDHGLARLRSNADVDKLRALVAASKAAVEERAVAARAEAESLKTRFEREQAVAAIRAAKPVEAEGELLAKIMRLEESLSDLAVNDAVRESGVPVAPGTVDVADTDKMTPDDMQRYLDALEARVTRT